MRAQQWTRQEILALTALQGLRKQKIIDIVENFESAHHFLETSNLGRWFTSSSLFGKQQWEEALQFAEKQVRAAEEFPADIVTYWDDRYPQLLREIYYPPVILYVWGTMPPPDALMVAIVGTRRCSPYGRTVAEQFATSFAQARIPVVSGLAYGIDSIAHRATVKAGGITYAVIAAGLDKLSPYTAVRLAEEIVTGGGAVLTEYPFGVRALPAYFPQRNRIISGISRAVVVVESGERSGALITAQFALDQNRELFAVPGNITSEKSRGTNALIYNSQAVPAISPNVVLEYFGIRPQQWMHEIQLTPEEEAIYQKLSTEPVHIDELAMQLEQPVAHLVALLLQLEFKGVVRQLPGKYFVRL